MTDFDRGALGSGDEDRLPWLEAVDDEDDGEGIGAGKLIVAVIAALVAIGLVIGGIFWMRERSAAPGVAAGGVIAAPKGDYKVAPDGATANGMTIDGEGDATFAASEGGDISAPIDTNARPEAPLTGNVTSVDAASVRPRALPPSTAAGPKAPTPPVTAQPKAPVVPPARPKATAAATPARPVPPPAVRPAPTPTPAAAAPAAGSARIKIGAFSTAALANEGWRKLTAQYPGLRGLSHSVLPGQSGGATVYRLYASGPADQVTTICRAMGSGCIRS